MNKELERTREYSELDISVSALRAPEPGPHGPALLGGEQFAKYLLVGEIARGGMGEILLGLQQGLEGFSKVVVVKRMANHLTRDLEFIQMFIDEARLAARLEHPNIVKTYEFSEHEGQYYTVMEYLAGEDLRTVLNKLALSPHKKMSLSLAVHILTQICNGLHFAHELTDPDGVPLNLVHRDINPANIIVTYSGEVKVIDFGVAKVSTAVKKTLAGVIKGKIAYMPPENILARGVDRRSDVFSTGIILWEVLMGRPLFARDCDAATMYAVLNDPIPKPGKHRPDVPPQLSALIMRALSRTPSERFASADDMRAALDEVAGTLPKVDARAIGQMMEEVFGTTRAQAKRAITQSRSLARNIPLVMKPTAPLSAAASLPDTAPLSSSAPRPAVAAYSIATPLPAVAPMSVTAPLPAIARMPAVAPLPVAVPPPVAAQAPTQAPTQAPSKWPSGSDTDIGAQGAGSATLRQSLPRLFIGGAIAGVVAVAAIVLFGSWGSTSASRPSATLWPPSEAPRERAPAPLATEAPSTVPPTTSPEAAVARPSAHGTLTVETRPDAMVYLDGKPIEQGSFSRRSIAQGFHELAVKMPGRAPVKRTISIAADRETKLKLDPAP